MKSAAKPAQYIIKKTLHRLFLAVIVIFFLPDPGLTQGLKAIRLNEPNKKRGLPFMEALSVKASAREWSEKELSLQDLSDLVWAANGINRPEEKKYTASSAMNAHDVDLYLFMKEGVYVYDADAHVLNPIVSGDFRSQLMMTPPPRPKDSGGLPPPPRPAPSNPPIQIILISDCARFRAGKQELKYEWGAIDAGIVSQNISLFCAATGLKTRPRASMDKEKIRKLLNLKETQYVFLNHPIGYAK
jgi:hypothetical protein